MKKYKFYSPVKGVIDYTGNGRREYAAYFDYDPAEICGKYGEENFDYLSSEDIPQYARDINAAIQRDWAKMKMEKRGFMTSFLWSRRRTQTSVYEKVRSALPKIEVINDKAYAVVECSITSALAADEVETLKGFFTWQYSDGWGDGFGQHAIQTKWGALYVCFWPEDSMIETEEEFNARIDLGQGEQPTMGMGV